MKSHLSSKFTGVLALGLLLILTGCETVPKTRSVDAQGPEAINTAAIPKDLLESELFGHERGAFTGAQAMRRGRFVQAASGA